MGDLAGRRKIHMMVKHSVPRETIVDAPKDLTVGTPVTVYWSHGKKKFWKKVIAPDTKGKSLL